LHSPSTCSLVAWQLLLLLLLLQFLQQNKWSLSACEQVLSNHQAARYKNHPQDRPFFDPVNR
jgi:hypothetical protein